MFQKYSAQKEFFDPVPENVMIMDIFDIENKPGRNIGVLPEPGVPVTVIFTSYFDTQLKYTFSHSPAPFAANHTFLSPDKIENTTGDMSVPSYSVMMPISRWISKGNRGKPVKAVELCGLHGPFGQHYDSLPCECVNNQFVNQVICSHACMISDPYVIRYAVDLLTNHGLGYSDDDAGKALDLTENDLQDIAGNCLSLGSIDIRVKYRSRAKKHHVRQ
jgi:hypothetical protein